VNMAGFLDSLDQPNLIALAICTGIVMAWLQITQQLAKRRWCSSATARKWVHILTGPLYILCWNFFPRYSTSARYYAALLPTAILLKFAAIGLGLVEDRDTVNSMSRSGNRTELLYGPCFYGIIFILSTIWYWGNSPFGITALMLLCCGDGFAGLLGGFYGKTKLPWNRDKSWVGSISFFFFSIASSSAFIYLFNTRGWFSVTYQQFMPTLLWTTLVATFVESLPGVGYLDNITVFAASLITLHTLW